MNKKMDKETEVDYNNPLFLKPFDELCEIALNEFLSLLHVPDNFNKGLNLLCKTLEYKNIFDKWEELDNVKRYKTWEIFIEIVRKTAYQTRPYCVRCGECCMQSGPSLYQRDMKFIADGTIKLSDLYTLRQGETAYSYQERRLMRVEDERIKIKEVKDGGHCRFYDKKSGCTIYDSRPLQCRIQKCWDTDSPSSGTNESSLARLDIPGIDDELLELISIHSQKCPAEKISRYCTELIEGEKKHLEQLLEILSYDYRIRQATLKRLYEPDELDLFFGRPAERIIQHFGFNIEKDADGNFVFLEMTAS